MKSTSKILSSACLGKSRANARTLAARLLFGIFAASALVLLASPTLTGDEMEKTKMIAGTVVHYKVVLPNGYDPRKAYPAILTFGGGPQTMNTVDRVLDSNFRDEAEK